jgi:hypothetical protein
MAAAIAEAEAAVVAKVNQKVKCKGEQKAAIALSQGG